MFKTATSFIRRLLKPFFKEGKYYKVRFGKLRGMRNYYQQNINMRTLLGLYERNSIAVLSRVFEKFQLSGRDVIIADVGVIMGFYSFQSPRKRWILSTSQRKKF